ncbi:MAG: heat-inducible transcriptional repressor HrcA [Alphaproteobacteria bacterium]|nr:heat-inducible transcriptional repressor HrcA [Alphaproteobacteria bacterium]
MIIIPKRKNPDFGTKLNERSREIFRHIVDAYVETGEPIGSRTISHRLGLGLSAATIRNVMADLEEAGLLYAPHTSAGRLPTEQGLHMFVDGLLEVGGPTEEERQSLDHQCAGLGRSFTEVLDEVTRTLSGLSKCAGLVVAPKTDLALKHIEFVHLGPGRALVVMVTEDGQVENRILDVPRGLPNSALVEASNYLATHLVGRRLNEARAEVLTQLDRDKAELDSLTRKVVESGLAIWSGDSKDGALIVRGQQHLLDDITAMADLERIRMLFTALESKEALLRLIDVTESAEGVQIFIGSENEFFDLAGCSLVIAPYRNNQKKLIGAIGVIGPKRLDYARIIPMVDYTAKVISRLMS